MTTRERITEILLRAGLPAVPHAVVEELEQLVVANGPPEVFRQQLRLKCAEIVWMGGSQDHRAHLSTYARQLYNFAIDIEKKED